MADLNRIQQGELVERCSAVAGEVFGMSKQQFSSKEF
jgi:hypothetical protein